MWRSGSFPTPKTVGLATGVDFPDALAGGYLVGVSGGPMLLVAPTAPLPASVAAYLSGPAQGLAPSAVMVFGWSGRSGRRLAVQALASTEG